jgi:hypothetical protein
MGAENLRKARAGLDEFLPKRSGVEATIVGRWLPR